MKNKIKVYLIGFIIFSFLQNISLFDFGGISLKIIHVYSLIGCFFLFSKKIVLPNKWINLLYLVFIINSLFAFLFFDFNSLIVNYIFGYFVLVLIINLLSYFEFNEKILILQKGVFISYIIVLINLCINMNSIIEYLNNPYGGHPDFNFIIQGGANIEASWVAIFSVVFYNKNKKKYIPVLFSLLVSILYGSRSATIINAIIVFVYLYDFICSHKKFFIFILVFSIVAILILMQFDSFSILLDRFTNIGKEPGSLGRLNMWLKFIPTFKRNFFGYGCGNATKAITLVCNVVIPDDNVHNLILQYSLDFGILGLISIVCIYCYFFSRIFIYKSKNIFCNILALYYFIGLIQFRGGEIFFFILVGYYLSSKFEAKTNIERSKYECVTNNA